MLDVSGKSTWSHRRKGAEYCAEKCLNDESCLSFEDSAEMEYCYQSKESAATSTKMIELDDRDYYQKIDSNYSLYFTIKLFFLKFMLS